MISTEYFIYYESDDRPIATTHSSDVFRVVQSDFQRYLERLRQQFPEMKFKDLLVVYPGDVIPEAMEKYFRRFY
jgi:hypothetical protein